jgi:glycerate kinase
VRRPTEAGGAIDAIEAAGGLRDAKLEVLCDTTVPFERAADVFAAQKGASPEQVEELTRRLVALAGALPRDPRGAGDDRRGRRALGWSLGGARRASRPGATFVLGVLGFDRRLEEADAVITGEGRLDDQSRRAN